MKKLIIVYVVLIAAVILLFIARGGGNLFSFLPSVGQKATAEINGQKINLIIAKSEKDRVKGLSGRNSLPQDQGMLFVFENKGKHPFWMKDMKFSIDIIYIDGNKVVYTVKNAEPAKGQVPAFTIYKPDQSANYVLEVNSGLAEKLKIETGTKVTFKGL